jgi:hypothetical protein
MFQLGSFQSPGFQLGTNYGVRANYVASDILISETDLSFAQFQTQFANLIPVGYEPFEKFQVGDYEYKKALYRGQISTDGNSVPAMNVLQVQVDVPDVFDTGTDVITVSGTKTIPFHKSFYIAPEIVCSMKGGAVFAVPRITNVTRTQFTVELMDSTGAPLAGTITWSAHGY